MNNLEKYGENTILLGSLRQYVENGTMLASVNFYRDIVQNFAELKSLENRRELLISNPDFSNNVFLAAFINEEFAEIEGRIPEDVVSLTLKLIEEHEGVETAKLTAEFLLAYSISIAKSSKEDWLAFVGIKDDISDNEEKFIQKLKELFGMN
jgi:hypothetical protein